MSNFTSSLSHIYQDCNGVKAIVSVQVPQVSGFQSLSDSFSGLFGNKRLGYLVLDNNGLHHVQTVGASVVKKSTFSNEAIDEIKLSSRNLSGTDLKLVDTTITTKKITYKKVKEGKETKQVEVPNYTSQDFTLFPIAFQANFKYTQSAAEVIESTEMRKTLIGYLENLKSNLENRN